jgi:predicted flap endonuclease-1-like 5' DNA nuclease
MSKLTTIEGIGEVYEAKFVEVGIKSVEALLEAGATKKGRIDLAEKSGISEKLVLKFVNHADLFRIKGIAGEYAELLEAAGVDTVVELAGRRPDNLTAKLAEVNEEKKLVRRVPVLKEVTSSKRHILRCVFVSFSD